MVLDFGFHLSSWFYADFLFVFDLAGHAKRLVFEGGEGN